MKRTASGEEKPSTSGASPRGVDDGTAQNQNAKKVQDRHDAPPQPQPSLGQAARRARVDDGSNPALELAIETDDELEAEELLRAEGAGADDLDDLGRGEGNEEGGDAATAAAGLLPQEELIRRRLRRMKELKSLYLDQYWRLLEDLRRRHYRYTLRNGHGGRKEEAAAAAQERERAGLPGTCASEGCDAKPMPLSSHCFAHICADPKQVLYSKPTNPAGKDEEEEDALPILLTDDDPPAPSSGAGPGATAAVVAADTSRVIAGA